MKQNPPKPGITFLVGSQKKKFSKLKAQICIFSNLGTIGYFLAQAPLELFYSLFICFRKEY